MQRDSMPSPFDGGEHQWRAASLAHMIMSGALDVDPNNPKSDLSRSRGNSSAPSTRSTTRPANNVPQVHTAMSPRPLVQSCSDHMINKDPIPLFLTQAMQGVYAPDVRQLTAASPFVDPCSERWAPSTHGVVVIRNVPFCVVKNEIVSVIGRTANIITQPEGTSFEAVHIIMDRTTGKTMECYVELATRTEACKVYERFQARSANGKAPRVQDRQVILEISSQGALMQALFPRAKCVTWQGQVPHVYSPQEAYDSGFRGFLTGEEMTMCVKHAQTPTRSPFAGKHLQRPYENLISTLNKYPWFATDHISIDDRALLFKMTTDMVQQLMKSLNGNHHPVQLSRELLQELLCTALNAPFSQQQKARLASIVYDGSYGEMIEASSYVPLGGASHYWPFEVLDRKLTVQAEVLHYYISLIRRATSLHSPHSAALSRRPAVGVSPFGGISIDYGGAELGALTLDDVVIKEMDTVHGLLVRAAGQVAHLSTAQPTHMHMHIAQPMHRPMSTSTPMGRDVTADDSPILFPAHFRPDDHDAMDKYAGNPLNRDSGLTQGYYSDSASSGSGVDAGPMSSMSPSRFLTSFAHVHDAFDGMEIVSNGIGSARLVDRTDPQHAHHLSRATTQAQPRSQAQSQGEMLAARHYQAQTQAQAQSRAEAAGQTRFRTRGFLQADSQPIARVQNDTEKHVHDGATHTQAIGTQPAGPNQASLSLSLKYTGNVSSPESVNIGGRQRTNTNAAVFDRAPGSGRLNAACAPFSPRQRAITTGASGFDLDGSAGASGVGISLGVLGGPLTPSTNFPAVPRMTLVPSPSPLASISGSSLGMRTRVIAEMGTGCGSASDSGSDSPFRSRSDVGSTDGSDMKGEGQGTDKGHVAARFSEVARTQRQRAFPSSAAP